MDQARALIRCVVIAEREGEDIHAFLSVNDKDGISYRTVSEVRSSRDLQARVLKQAEKELEAFETRYRELSDICRLVREAREIVIQRRNEVEARAQA